MAYTIVVEVQNPLLVFFQWSRPDGPTPRLAAPISASDTTLIFTDAPKDHTGAVVSAAFLMGITNAEGYTETVYVPAAALSADGLTATGVTRGVRLEGLDVTTGDSTLAAAAGQDSIVFCNVAGALHNILTTWAIGSLRSGGVNFKIGTGAAANITLFFVDNQGSPSFIRKNNTTARIEFSHDGTTTWEGMPRYTTVQINALTSPPEGMLVYDTTTGEPKVRQGGAWIVLASGGVFPNASETVAGKVQAATVAQQGTHTSTGSTGALLFPQVGNLIKTSSGAGDENKMAVLDASGQFATGFIPSGTDSSKIAKSVLSAKGSLVGATAAATPADVPVGTNNQVLVADSAQANGVKWGAVPFLGANYASVTASRAGDAANGNQVIAHGLGKIPGRVKVTALKVISSDIIANSFGSYNGTIQNASWSSIKVGTGASSSSGAVIAHIDDGSGAASQEGTITAMDATNITIAWVKTGAPGSSGIELLVETEG
jgi:hypothetical protein